LHFFFQAEDGIRDFHVTGVQTCALPICLFGGGSRPFISQLADRYRRDAEYRLELDFCFDHAGIPHSELLSWEPEDRAKVHMWMRSEERRVGKEDRSRWWADHDDKREAEL